MFAGFWNSSRTTTVSKKAEMYYWQNLSRGTNAEIGFLEAKDAGMVWDR